MITNFSLTAPPDRGPVRDRACGLSIADVGVLPGEPDDVPYLPDPHQSYRTENSTAHYVAVCQGCHQSVVHKASLPAGTNCLSCHMPKRRTDDVVHVVMTDHYIQRVKPDLICWRRWWRWPMRTPGT